MKKICKTGVVLACCLAVPTLATANDDWRITSDVQAQFGSYSKSLLRDNVSSAGAIVAADYLDKAGFTVAGSGTKVKFKTTPTITQQSYFLSGRYHLFLDALPGILTLRLDGHAINNNDTTGNTDGVRVIAPQLSFTNFDKTWYVDLGYARSTYKNNLTLNQYTPTLGLGFNEQADWLQVRGYLIDVSNPARAQNKKSTAAGEVKWSHWFAPGNVLALHKMQLGLLAGERVFAVDGDAAAIYNLADVQRGSATLGLTWKTSDNSHIMVLGGQERYLDNTIGNSYTSRFGYVDASVQW